MKIQKIKFFGLLALASLAATGVSAPDSAAEGSAEEEDFDLMGFFDTNQDGKVEKEEFMNYLGSLDEIQQNFEDDSWRASGEMAFQVYDKDQNLVLDRAEFATF